MAQIKGKIPHATALKLMASNLMNEAQFAEGLASGAIAPATVTRDYGPDQPYYLEIQKYVDKCNLETTTVKFSVTTRSKVVDDGEGGDLEAEQADAVAKATRN